ncbi:MAG: electron transport complex subunit E [Candidatus Omnitrophica bacterium]|nr:electron transport complex subunit E [Candidatus Omnitrophota bacterium]
MNKFFDNLTKGILKENPTFITILGMCPTLGVTTLAANGIGMGLATTFVLIMSNVFIAILKNLIPDKVRIPAYIVIIATFVTIVDLVIAGYFPALYAQLGIFIPLIVVNCIILGRAEAYAAKNNVLDSLIDGVSMGAGLTLALTLIGAIREVLGTGAIFGHKLIASDAILIFVLPPGAFIVLAYVIALVNKINKAIYKG